MVKFLNTCLILAFLGGVQLSVFAADPVDSVQVTWKNTEGDRVLGKFRLTELPSSAHKKTQEKDPVTGDVVAWDGYLLSALIEKSWTGLSVDQRATVDLIVLKGRDGVRAAIPRVIVDKNPMILALKRKGQDVGTRGPVYSVVPWTSQSKLKQEPLPFDRYFIAGVDQVELTNSKTVYGSYFLNKRSDPRAVRGERLFVQACMGCHDSSAQAAKKREYALSLAKGVEHKTAVGLPHFTETDQKALQSYFKVLSLEVQTQN